MIITYIKKIFVMGHSWFLLILIQRLIGNRTICVSHPSHKEYFHGWRNIMVLINFEVCPLLYYKKRLNVPPIRCMVIKSSSMKEDEVWPNIRKERSSTPKWRFHVAWFLWNMQRCPYWFPATKMSIGVIHCGLGVGKPCSLELITDLGFRCPQPNCNIPYGTAVW